MRAAVTIGSINTYYTLGLKMLKRSIGSAPKDDYLERVPFSSVTYDFGAVCGEQSYGERPLTYRFELVDLHKRRAQDSIVHILNVMHWTGRRCLIDSLYPDFHFNVREPVVSVEGSHGIYTIVMTFKAEPHMYPNSNKMYTAETVNFPDVNGDGIVDGSDVTMILAAYANMGAGLPSGLTPEQERAADADMDGMITGADATLAQHFYAEAGSGKYENSPAGFAEFMNEWKNMGKGVI
ncbi:MAG: hypothetical protein IJJ57_02885 [Ruminococcus sp.]|nr:hypothetical protein [Ruminococcus sp.]MBQ9808855.1 hypothetical protein [Ruminococcus sp.]